MRNREQIPAMLLFLLFGSPFDAKAESTRKEIKEEPKEMAPVTETPKSNTRQRGAVKPNQNKLVFPVPKSGSGVATVMKVEKKEDKGKIIKPGEKVEKEEIDMEEAKLPELKPGDFRVREYEGELELHSPYGDFVIKGNFGQDGQKHYKFSVPIKEILPEPEPETELEEEQELGPDDNALIAGTGEGGASNAFNQKETLRVETIRESTHSNDKSRTPLGQFGAPPLVQIDDTDSLIVKANHLYNRRRFYESFVVVEKIILKQPENVRAWLMKGSLLMVQGHKDLALKAWRQAQLLKPEDKEIGSILQRYQ